MIKHAIRHTCGHEAMYAFPDAEPERRRREDWLRGRPCQACWRTEQSRSAAEQGREWKLPPLEGTDEENAWAEVIRLKAMTHNRDYHNRLVKSPKVEREDEAMRNAIIEAADSALHELENQRSASWWIANRFDSLGFVKQRVTSAVAPILDSREKAQ